MRNFRKSTAIKFDDVCLAVWLAIAGKDSISKIFGIYFPILAFVASGFEHSIANVCYYELYGQKL